MKIQISKKGAGYILLSIVIIVVLAILIVIIYPKKSYDFSIHPDTPEELVLEFNNRLNENYIKEAISLTTFRFHPDFEDEDFQSLYSDTIIKSEYSDIQVKYESSLNQSEMDIINQTMLNIDTEYDIMVEDYCLIYYNETIIWPGYGPETALWYHVCVKIDTKWYIYAPPYEE